MRKAERVGFYPGTFDPPTFGHLDVIARAANLFDRVIVGVAVSASKNPLLSVQERVACLKASVASLTHPNANIDVISFSSLLVDALHETGADFVIRGLRSPTDFDYEMQLFDAISKLAPGKECVYLASRAEQRSTAASVVREIAAFGGDLSAFVPQEVARLLDGRFARARGDEDAP